MRHDCGVCKGTGYLITNSGEVNDVKVVPSQVEESDFEKINMTTISEVVPEKIKRKYTRKDENVLRGT